MKKLVIIGSIVLLIAIGAGVYYLGSNLGSVVARAIERDGSEVTETSVSVSGVRIALRDGRGSIQGLHVASPDGFDARDAFTLGDITIALDVASERSPCPRFDWTTSVEPRVPLRIRSPSSS